jgi:type IV secretory pathway VirD2 relaxase
VKIQYVANRSPGGWRAHGRYLSREGAQREGARGLGFDASGEGIAIEDRLGAWQKAGDRRLWKVILSPEQGHRLDLRQHARELFGAVEADLGTRLEWVAIDHYNTAHPHVHVVIRGLDEEGRTLAIPAEYVRDGIRARSQELATRRLGYRTAQDRERARERAIQAPHFGELDAILEQRVDGGRVVAFDGLVPPQPPAQALRLHLIGRLQFLESIGLAERTGPRSWRLSELHRPGLRQMQLLRDIQKSVARGDLLLTDPSAPQALLDLGPGENVRGRIAGTTFGEVEERIFLVVEAGDGRVLLMPETAEMERRRREGGLQRGTVVTLEGRQAARDGGVVRWTDVHEHGKLEELEQAAEAGNLLDVAVLERATGPDPDRAGESPPAGFGMRWERALARRALVLEQAGLLRQEIPGRWTAEPGALAQIRARMRQRDRLPMSFAEVEQMSGKPIQAPSTIPGMLYRGRLVAYAEDEHGERHAVLDEGRVLWAVPTERRDLAVGTQVRARSGSARGVEEASERERKRGLMWQLADLERERDRGRGR